MGNTQPDPPPHGGEDERVSRCCGRGTGDAFLGIGSATLAAFRRCVGTGSRRWLVVATLLLGLMVTVALTMAEHPAGRTLAALAGPVQILMSVLVPFVGVLATHDLYRSPGPAQLVSTVLAAALLAAVVGAVGALACVGAVAVAGSAAPGRWDHAGTIVVGGVLVQVVAQLVGTGLGLLVRPVVVAFLATIVLPLGLWLLLGSTDLLRPAQGWLTPYATAQRLLSGRMSLLTWSQWFVMFLLWGVCLNAVSAVRRKRWRPTPP